MAVRAVRYEREATKRIAMCWREERLKWQNRVEGGEHGEGASFLLPEGLGAGRDDPQVILVLSLVHKVLSFPPIATIMEVQLEHRYAI
jgi:hypothetical protein